MSLKHRRLRRFLALTSIVAFVSMDGSFSRSKPPVPVKRPSPGECFERDVALGRISYSNDLKELIDAAEEASRKSLLNLIIAPEGFLPLNECP